MPLFMLLLLLKGIFTKLSFKLKQKFISES